MTRRFHPIYVQHVRIAIVLALVLSACSDEPAFVASEPEVPFVPETLSASLEADPRIGPPGYETTITASCVARGTQAGILQFFVRGRDTGQINYSVSNPQEDSIAVVLPAEVNQRTVVSMRCAGTSGEVIEDEVVLGGYVPEILVDDFPDIVLREDTPLDVPLSRDLFRHAVSLDVFSLVGVLSVQLLNWETSPVLRLVPLAGRHGAVSLRLQATNPFGVTEATIETPIVAVSDLTYDLRVAGSLSPASTTISWYDDGQHLLGSADHPPYMVSRQLDDVPSGTVVVEAGTDPAIFFPIRRTYDTTDGKDILLLTTLHQTQYCRQIFASFSDPLAMCRGLVSEVLFTYEGEHGYRPYPILPWVSILTQNPETGQPLPDEWLAAFERVIPLLDQLGVSIQRRDVIDPEDYDRGTDGQLLFDAGSWLYPQTASEPVDRSLITLHAGPPPVTQLPDPAGLIKSVSRAIDVTEAPPPDDQLVTDILEVAYGIQTPNDWHALDPSVQRDFLEEVVRRFRFDDRTAWAIEVGATIDSAMRLPE